MVEFNIADIVRCRSGNKKPKILDLKLFYYKYFDFLIITVSYKITPNMGYTYFKQFTSLEINFTINSIKYI